MMKVKPMLKYFQKKKNYWIILGLFTICIALISAANYSITFFGESTDRERIIRTPINFYSKTTRYHLTHPYLKTAIEESIFEIEAEYTANLYYFSEMKLIFNYNTEDESINEWGEFTRVYVIGIDEAYYTRLQQPEYEFIIDFPNTWNEFSGHISLFSSFERKFQQEMEQLSVSCPNQGTLRFTNDVSNTSQTIPISQNNSILNLVKMYKLFGITPRDDYILNPILIGDIDSVSQLFQNVSISRSTADIILIEQNYLEQYSVSRIRQQFWAIHDDYVRERLNPELIGTDFSLDTSFVIHSSTLVLLQIWVFIFLVPLFIISYRFLRTAYKTLLVQEKQELGLLLLNGISRKLLKRYLFGFLCVLGIVGGVLGSLIGIFLSAFIGKSVFPHFHFSSTSMIQYNQFNLIQTTLLYGLISGVIAIFTFRKPLNYLFSDDISALISETTKSVKNPRLQRNVDLVLFLFGILTIFFIYYLQINNNTYIDLYMGILYYKESIEGLKQVTRIFTPILLIIPFIFPLVLVRSVFQHLPALIRTLKTKFSRTLRKRERILKFKFKMIVWGFKTKGKQYRSNLQNFTLSIVLITMFMSLNQSYIYTSGVYDSIVRGNGELVDLYLDEPVSLANLTKSIHKIEADFVNLPLESMNTIYFSRLAQNNYNYHFDTSGIKITYQNLPYSSITFFRFCTTNFTRILEQTVFRDEWFVGGSATEIFTKMQEQEDAILIPNDMLDSNFTIGGPFCFKYKTLDGTTESRKGTVVGAFKMLPAAIQSRYNFEGSLLGSIFMNSALLTNLIISIAEILLYNPIAISSSQYIDLQSMCTSSISQTFHFQIVNIADDYDPVYEYLFKFLKTETFLVIIFTVLGIGLNLSSSYSKKNLQMGLLRARGFTKKDLLALSLQETGVFAIIGLIFSLVSLTGPGIYRFVIDEWAGDHQFPLYSRVNYTAYFLTLGLGGILFMGVNILLSLRSIKQTDTKKDLEKILRYRY